MSSFSTIDTAVRNVPLKDMEASLLSSCIRARASELHMDAHLFDDAITFASLIHRRQTRAQRGWMPRVHYIEHPLRNTVRLIRYGVTDQTTLLASILHDTVEDGSEEIAEKFGGRWGAPNEASDRLAAFDFISGHFGDDVSDVVFAVTNPLHPAGTPKSVKNAAYVGHVAEAVEAVRPALVKFSDFVDNAASLQHTVSPENAKMVAHLAAKYGPLVDVFEARVARADFKAMMPADGAHQVARHLESARQNVTTLAA